MKKFWKILLIVLAVLLAAVVLLFAWLTITEYRPDPVTALDVASSQDGALPIRQRAQHHELEHRLCRAR